MALSLAAVAAPGAQAQTVAPGTAESVATPCLPWGSTAACYPGNPLEWLMETLVSGSSALTGSAKK